MIAPARWKTRLDTIIGVGLILIGGWELLVGRSFGLVVVLVGREFLFHPGQIRSRFDVLVEILQNRKGRATP